MAGGKTDIEGGKVKLNGDDTVEFLQMLETQEVTQKILRFEERDKEHQRIQQRADFGLAHAFGMALGMEEKEPLNSFQIRLFRSSGWLAEPHHLAASIHETRLDWE